MRYPHSAANGLANQDLAPTHGALKAQIERYSSLGPLIFVNGCSFTHERILDDRSRFGNVKDGTGIDVEDS